MLVFSEYSCHGGIVDSSLCMEEDEELRIAMNELFDTVSTTVQTELTNDVEDLLSYIESALRYCFPRVFLYRKQPNVLQDDLWNAFVFLGLLGMAVFLLAPLCHRSNKGSTNAAAGTHTTTVTATTATDCATPSKRELHTRQESSPCSSWNNNNNSSNDATTEEESDHSESNNNSKQQQQTNYYWWIGGEEENTDDDRFELMYDRMLQNAKYRRLMLPPCCRKIIHNTPMMKNKPTTTPRTNHINATTTVPTAAIIHNEDDDPAARLQRYMRELYHFLRLILLFDFTTAARLLLDWYQGIRKLHSSCTATTPSTITPSSRTRTNTTFSMDDSCNHHNLVNNHCTNHVVDQLNAAAMTNQEGINSAILENPTIVAPNENHTGSKNETTLSVEISEATPTATTLTTPIAPTASLLSYEEPLKTGDETSSSSLRHRDFSMDILLDRPPSMDHDDNDDDNNNNNNDTNDCNSSNDENDSHNFFDANSSVHPPQHSLLKIQVPIPDKNGYIMLADEFLHDGSNDTPLLVFVNSRSGPQQGILLLSQLRRILNPIQVWDLADGGPEPILESFLQFTKLRILVCGGDGTVAWIVSALEKFQKWPPIAILPLGTGNDLARIHGWGGGYNNESLIRILEQIDSSYVSLLDRWQVQIQDLSSSSSTSSSSSSTATPSTSSASSAATKKTTTATLPVTEKSFFNYMGVGADAQASLHVHYLRESRPKWFFSRIVNKAFYGVFGAEDIIKANNRFLRKELTLVADGVPVPLPSDSQGIILLNIDSYAGGVPLWSHGTPPTTTHHHRSRHSHHGNASTMTQSSHDKNRRTFGDMIRCESTDDILHNSGLSIEERFEKVTACNRPSSCQDGYLDVISIRGAFHLGQIKVGLSNAQRLCQCREAVITIKNQVAVQVDGEPWRQKASQLTIRRKKDPAVMLHRSVDDGGIETEVCSLLDWAEERKMIDRQIHAALMKEFSRRIEGRTRQRRNRAVETGVMSTLKKAISSGAISSSQQQQLQQQKGLWYHHPCAGMYSY